MNKLDALSKAIKKCRICRDTPCYIPGLPVEPHPVAWLSQTAEIVIAGQAPGMRVYETGIPFNDRSGDRLRDWLNVSREQFYNLKYFSIVPMGFCFPGYDSKGSDLPPRRECAPQWHEEIFQTMTQTKLVLAIGQYAQKWHIQTEKHRGVTDMVRNWRSIVKQRQPRGYHVLPLPHPSWRNTAWIKQNPWFEDELVPYLRKTVADFLQNSC